MDTCHPDETIPVFVDEVHLWDELNPLGIEP